MIRALALWLVAASCLASCSESTGPIPTPPFQLELIAGGLANPTGVAVGVDGTIFVAEYGNQGGNGRTSRINADGALTTLDVYDESDLSRPFDLAVDREDRVRVVTFTRMSVPINPRGIAITVDNAGSVYEGHFYNGTGGTRRLLSKDGITLAGRPNADGCRDGLGSDASFGPFLGIAVGHGGTIFVSNPCGVRAVTQGGQVTTPYPAAFFPSLGMTPTLSGLATDAAGNLYASDQSNAVIYRIDRDGVRQVIAGTPGTDAVTVGESYTLAHPTAVAVDGDTLVITDSDAVYRLRPIP